MKKYAYLLFALFFTFSACQDDVVEEAADTSTVQVEPTTFTFVYKGKEYQEVRSSVTDQMQNKVIEDVLARDSYSVHQDVKRGNKFFLFDNSEELKEFLGVSSVENGRLDCDAGNATGGHTANLVLYRNRNYDGRRGRSAGWIFGNGASSLWKSYSIDNYPRFANPVTNGLSYLNPTGDFPCSLRLPTLGAMGDKASSLAFSHRPVLGPGASREFGLAQQNQRATVILYNKSNYDGISISFTLRGYATDLQIPNLKDLFFYDFLGAKYGPTWEDKFSSLEMYFNN